MYQCVMDLVKMVVQLKNDVNTLPSSEYISIVKVTLMTPFIEKIGDVYPGIIFCFLIFVVFFFFFIYNCFFFFFQQSVGMTLRDLISSVDDIIPSLQGAIRTEVTL